MMTYTSFAKQFCWNFSSPCRILSVAFFIFLYCQTTLDRFLLANVMDQRIALSSISSYLQLRSFLTCSNAVPRYTPYFYLFLSIMDFWHSTSNMCLLSPMIWLFHIPLGMICSTSKKHWLMSASYVVCILLQSLVKTCSGNLLYQITTAVIFLFWVVAYQWVP